MTMKDPLALLRAKDPLSLVEAAAAVCDVPLGRTYPIDSALTPEQRAERDNVRAILSALKADVETGLLPVDKVFGGRPAEVRENWVTGRLSRSPGTRALDASRTTIARADLETWCRAHGLLPAIFESSDDALRSAQAFDLDMPADVADRITCLRQAWSKHWKSADPEQGDTWPKPGAVEATLKRKGFGSDSLCKAGATIVRPSWAKGRPPKGDE